MVHSLIWRRSDCRVLNQPFSSQELFPCAFLVHIIKLQLIYFALFLCLLVKESYPEKEKGGVLQTFKRTLSRKGKKKEKSQSKEVEKASEDENG